MAGLFCKKMISLCAIDGWFVLQVSTQPEGIKLAAQDAGAITRMGASCCPSSSSSLQLAGSSTFCDVVVPAASPGPEPGRSSKDKVDLCHMTPVACDNQVR
jgi:hypothetical protein